jgi:hypothetical protein
MDTTSLIFEEATNTAAKGPVDPLIVVGKGLSC